MNKLKNGRQGFTLLELLVVVLIIGILAAIALPQYRKSVLRSRFTQSVISLNALIKSAEVYYMTHGTYVTNLNNLDVEIPTRNQYACYVDNRYISCRESRNGDLLFALQYHISQRKRYCCSYYDTNFVADNLCETEMHNSSWYNGCSEERPCHCYGEK